MTESPSPSKSPPSGGEGLTRRQRTVLAGMAAGTPLYIAENRWGPYGKAHYDGVWLAGSTFTPLVRDGYVRPVDKPGGWRIGGDYGSIHGGKVGELTDRGRAAVAR